MGVVWFIRTKVLAPISLSGDHLDVQALLLGYPMDLSPQWISWTCKVVEEAKSALFDVLRNLLIQGILAFFLLWLLLSLILLLLLTAFFASFMSTLLNSITGALHFLP